MAHDFKAGEYVLLNWNRKKIPACVVGVFPDQLFLNREDRPMGPRGENLSKANPDDVEHAADPNPLPACVKDARALLADPLWLHINAVNHPPVAHTDADKLKAVADAEKATKLPPK